MELLNQVNEKLNANFAGQVVSAEMLYDFPVFIIKTEAMHDVLKFLKEDAELNFHFLTDLTGMQTADEKQLGVIYHLHNMPKNLRIRLYDMQRQAKDAARSDARKSQVGSGDRSERIRTYNFPQGRVTDHRIGLTLHSLPQILEGDLDPMLNALIAEDQAARLADLEAELG